SALLEKTKTDGEAAHQHDEVCLAAHSRTRTALPFGLSDDDRRFIAFWLGGTYWRMRGGGLMPLGSTQAARWDFLEQPFTRIGELTGGKDGTDAAFDIYLAVFEGWSDWMDMGETQPGGDKYYDLVGMTARGARQVQSASQTLASRGYDVADLGAGGLGMGPCYFWGHEQLKPFRYADQMSPPYGAFIEGFTAVGEWCSGATIALGFAKTLLRGTATGKPPTVDLCAGRTCGDDTCGGSCGTCGDGLSCMDGKCIGAAAPQSTSPAVAPPSPPPSDAPAPSTDAPSSSSGCACRASQTDRPYASALLAIAVLAWLRRRAVR
ncbi:MAG TPA: hypothetical protein VIF62_29430, partial [Labilithrix sp.]